MNFLLFNKVLFNANLVIKIHRVEFKDAGAANPFGIRLLAGMEEYFEYFKSPDACTRRFNDLCEKVGADNLRGF